MPDKPIIFSAPMVRALLDGRKTQTRRLIKHRSIDLSISPSAEDNHPVWIQFRHPKSGPLTCVKRPYAPGDRLYVREAIDNASEPGDVFYRADYEAAHGNDGAGLGWRPSIHMPRWASRITLTVTEVRVQRLQEISAEDVQAEGACELAFIPPTEADTEEARGIFRTLWNSLHGPDAWDANPWVSALSFTVERGNIDQLSTSEARHER